MKKGLAGAILLALVAAAAGAQTITVTKPAGGETVVKGKNYTIVWTKSGTMGANVRITLRNAATLAEVLVVADPAPNIDSYAWPVPANIPDGSYKVRVKVKNELTFDDSDAFTIAAVVPPRQAQVLATKFQPADMLKKKYPRLCITSFDVGCNPDGFVVTFAYKSCGIDPLPKGSTLPVKPDFRILIDTKEVNHGSLYIPEFEAPPGWEVPAYHACDIPLQAPGEFDRYWVMGGGIDIKINENKAGGMPSDTKSWSLRNLTLIRCGYDASIYSAIYDWQTETLTTLITIQGHLEGYQKFRFFNTGQDSLVVDKSLGGFSEEHNLVPGQVQYEIKHKVHPPGAGSVVRGWLGVHVLKPGSPSPDIRDINHLNNYHYFSYQR